MFDPTLTPLAVIAGVLLARFFVIPALGIKPISPTQKRRLQSFCNDIIGCLGLATLVTFTAPIMRQQRFIEFDYVSDYTTWVPDMVLALAPMVIVFVLWLTAHRDIHGLVPLSTKQRLYIGLVLLGSMIFGGLTFVWGMQLDIIDGARFNRDSRWDYFHYGIGQLCLFIGAYIAVRIAWSSKPFFQAADKEKLEIVVTS